MDIGGSRWGISGGAGTGLAPFIPQNVSAEVCAHCVLRLLGERCHGRGCRAQLLCNAEVPLHLPALPNAAHLILELIPCSIFQARPGGAAVSPLAFLMCSLRCPAFPCAGSSPAELSLPPCPHLPLWGWLCVAPGSLGSEPHSTRGGLVLGR